MQSFLREIKFLTVVSLVSRCAFCGVTQTQQDDKAKGDNSGTNPINFTYHFRIWNEAQALPGENTFSKMTFEYRISENYNGLVRFYKFTLRAVLKWMNRRSQKRKMSWDRFTKYLEHYPLPKPKIVHSFYVSPVR